MTLPHAESICRVPSRRTVSHVRCRVPPRRAGNFHLLAQMKVTKAKCLNTHLARRLLSKSSRFTATVRTEAFPLGVARRLGGVAFWRLRCASIGRVDAWSSEARSRVHSCSSTVLSPARGRSDPMDRGTRMVRTDLSRHRRIPAYEVAKRRRVQEETGRSPRCLKKGVR